MEPLPYFDFTNLRQLVSDWWNCRPCKLEHVAFVKDMCALLQTAPRAAGSWNHASTHGPLKLGRFIADCVHTIRHFILPLISPQSSHVLVVSPFAGGIASSQLMVDDHAAAAEQGKLNVAVMNPGRSGLMSLSSDMLLEWRLWDIAAELIDNDVHICFLPGARLAAGIALPRSFPYAWVGDRSATWDTVGALVLLEIIDKVEVDSLISGGRVLFLNVLCMNNVCLHLGGFYAAPGGDEETWKTVLDYVDEIRRESRHAKVALLADGNVHFTGLVTHEEACGCLHCRQIPADRRIQSCCENSGMLIRNDGNPTHISGSVIDVVLTPFDLPCDCWTGLRRVGESDHFPVFAQFSFGLVLDSTCQLGRVLWSTEDVWEEALAAVAVELQEVSEAISEILEDSSFRPSQYGGSASKAFRRNIIDGAAWARNFLYVLAGHCAAAIVVMKPKPTLSKSWLLARPTDFDSYPEFKHAVNQRSWAEQQQATRKFLVLRETNPSLASGWISKAIASNTESSILLVSQETGRPLRAHEMASAVMSDLQEKVHVSGASGAPESMKSSRAIARIRANGGFQHASQGSRDRDSSLINPEVPFEIINDIIDSFPSSKRWLHGTAAALKANCAQGRSLTWSLVNLALWVGLTSTFWSLRLIRPIRKSGPQVVRRLVNLRPVSFGSDLAQVLDAVWVRQNKSLIEAFCGPGQLGGRSDPASAILAIVMLCQLREAQGAATYLAIADLQAAFDLADIPTMLLNIFKAGVMGCWWLLMDDILGLDQQVVCLHGFLSAIFSLGQGTAQGRRFSSFLFNAFAVNLSDAIKTVVPHGTCALWPPFAYQALVDADKIKPAESLDAPPSCVDEWRDAIDCIRRSFHIDSSPWAATVRLAASLLSDMPKLADRLLVLDYLGRFRVGPVQYIDDTTMPCPSVGAVAAVIGDTPSSACEQFSSSTGSKINRKPGKTTVMAMYGSPPPAPDVVGSEATPTHTCLGFLLDENLSMEPMLSAVVAQANQSLTTFCNAATCAGVPIPAIAAEIPARIVPIVKYRAPFLLLAPNFEKVLNDAQHKWALEVLGCERSTNLKRALIISQLGWASRLASTVIEEAIVAYARIQCLPADHPAAVIMQASEETTYPTWALVVRQHMERLRTFGWILPITEHAAFAPCILMATGDPAYRKQLVRKYRQTVVSPVVRAYDEFWRQTELTSFNEGLQVGHNELVYPVGYKSSALPWTLASVDLGHHTLAAVRTWLLVRCTGKWPPTRHLPTCPTFRDFCPWCGCALVSVSHALCECPQTANSRAALLGPQAAVLSTREVVQIIFNLEAPTSELQAYIYFVSEVLAKS